MHVNNIITFVYEFLNLLRHDSPQKWIFDEIREIEMMKFTLAIFIFLVFLCWFYFEGNTFFFVQYKNDDLPRAWLEEDT
jgi:hypothetical protein